MTWDAFIDLSASRQVGMVANPISYTDILAYRDLTHEPLTAWDVRLIKRLDDVVLKYLNPAPETNTVAASDGKSVLQMLRGRAKKGSGA